MIKHPEFSQEEEHFVDVDEEDDNHTTISKTEIATREEDIVTEPIDSYDPRKRDPKFASAEASCLWELVS